MNFTFWEHFGNRRKTRPEHQHSVVVVVNIFSFSAFKAQKLQAVQKQKGCRKAKSTLPISTRFLCLLMRMARPWTTTMIMRAAGQTTTISTWPVRVKSMRWMRVQSLCSNPKVPHSCTCPKYSTVLSFTAVLSSAVTLLLVKNLVLQRACCPETLATVHVPLLLAEGIFWCTAGNWWHAGYHLTVSIAAPALLSLPFALDGLGWAPGFLVLTIATAVSFYAYTLISKVLEQAELEGHRFLRFRDVAGYVLGKESILQPDSQFFL